MRGRILDWTVEDEVIDSSRRGCKELSSACYDVEQSF